MSARSVPLFIAISLCDWAWAGFITGVEPPFEACSGHFNAPCSNFHIARAVTLVADALEAAPGAPELSTTPPLSGGVVLGHALVQRPERDCGGVFHGAVALLVAVFQQDLMRWGRAHI